MISKRTATCLFVQSHETTDRNFLDIRAPLSLGTTVRSTRPIHDNGPHKKSTVAAYTMSAALGESR